MVQAKDFDGVTVYRVTGTASERTCNELRTQCLLRAASERHMVIDVSACTTGYIGILVGVLREIQRALFLCGGCLYIAPSPQVAYFAGAQARGLLADFCSNTMDGVNTMREYVQLATVR
jgi:hypothetical protein